MGLQAKARPIGGPLDRGLGLLERNELCQEALSYAERGWAVLPLHTPVGKRCSCGKPDCTDQGKHPRHNAKLLPSGCSSATRDLARVEEFFIEWPDANLAIATGAGSGLVVLDFDYRKLGEESLEDLETRHGKLPDTVTSHTGNGLHKFFAHPGGVICNHNKGVRLGPGIDVRGDGGYVAAPPSLHLSGRRYAWDVDLHPDHTGLAQLPDWLLSLIDPAPVGSQAASRWLNHAGPVMEDAEIIHRAMPSGYGQRNACLFDLARGARGNARVRCETLEDATERFLDPWWASAQSIVRTKAYRVSERDFVSAWKNAMVPLGVNLPELAYELAEGTPPPAASFGLVRTSRKNGGHGNARRELLLGACFQLQALQGDGWWLSCPDAARLAGVHPQTVHRDLKSFVRSGILEVVKKGDQWARGIKESAQATSYRITDQHKQASPEQPPPEL